MFQITWVREMLIKTVYTNMKIADSKVDLKAMKPFFCAAISLSYKYKNLNDTIFLV